MREKTFPRMMDIQKKVYLDDGRSQAPEKVTVTDLFYLRGLDVRSVNIPYLLAQYLRRFSAGRKSRAHIFGGKYRKEVDASAADIPGISIGTFQGELHSLSDSRDTPAEDWLRPAPHAAQAAGTLIVARTR
ncbi:hypothetical protein Tco_0333301 [Tanacetum coccineum]